MIKSVVTALTFVLVTMLMLACSRTDTSDEPSIGYSSPSLEYRGGIFVVWASFPTPIDTIDGVRWKMGNARIAERHSVIGPNGVESDTVYLHWEDLPRPRYELDTVLDDSGDVVSVDTTTIYEDTVSLVVNDVEGAPIIIRIYNILPAVDSLRVAGAAQPGDSNLVLAAHPGDRVTVRLETMDVFNLSPHLLTEWPPIGSFDQIIISDSIQEWYWQAPNVPMDTLVRLRIYDTGGFGHRDYNLRVVVYTEAGSAWVAAGSDIVKFSPMGAEVARVRNTFRDISDMALNSNANRLWVLDAASSSLRSYDAFGNLVFRDSTTFETPLSVAVDVESGYLWVSDIEDPSADTLHSRVRRFARTGDSIAAAGTGVIIPGPVRGLSIDQFQRDLLWFSSPESDFVGYLADGSSDPILFEDATFSFNRPSMVSFDPVNGRAWIADSSRVIVIDTLGDIQATITGFLSAVSVSAAGGVCWVADAIDGSVYQFAGNVSSTRSASVGLRVGGFVAPMSVSTFGADGGVWVVDRGSGEAIRLDGDGNRIASGTGLSLPSLVRVQQVLE